MRDFILIAVVVAISACDVPTGPDYPLELHVTGIVTSAADDRPIRQAQVILGESGLINGWALTDTVTNQSGEYEIRFVAQEDDCDGFGLYLTVVAKGYRNGGSCCGRPSAPKCREGVQEIDVALARIPD